MQTDPNWSNFFYDPQLHKVSPWELPGRGVSAIGGLSPLHQAKPLRCCPFPGGSSGLRGDSGIRPILHRPLHSGWPALGPGVSLGTLGVGNDGAAVPHPQ